MRIIISWREDGKRDIKDPNIKCTAFGKNYTEFQANLNCQELLEFLNFQENSQNKSKISYIKIEII